MTHMKNKKIITGLFFLFSFVIFKSHVFAYKAPIAIARTPEVKAQDVNVKVNNKLVRQVHVTKKLDLFEVYSYQMTLSVDPMYSKITNITFENTLVDSSKCLTAINLGTNLAPGVVKLAVACTEPIKGKGALAQIEYTGLKPTFGKKQQYVNVSEVLFNESTAQSTKARLMVTK